MSYRLIVELPGLTRLTNARSGGSTHWAPINKHRQEWRDAVCLATFRKKPPVPLHRARLKLTRFSSTCPDYDGLVSGFKAVVDGLVDAGVLIDDNMRVTGPWDCAHVKVPSKQARIRVEVEEIERAEPWW
jgi:Holliday junction resolvase RusA-like endonuclease